MRALEQKPSGWGCKTPAPQSLFRGYLHFLFLFLSLLPCPTSKINYLWFSPRTPCLVWIRWEQSRGNWKLGVKHPSAEQHTFRNKIMRFSIIISRKLDSWYQLISRERRAMGKNVSSDFSFFVYVFFQGQNLA